MDTFKIPSWFYLPAKHTIRTSTTAGNFDASIAVRSQGEEAWVSSIGQIKNPKKKKILIADWTLEQEIIDLMQFKKFTQELLKEGFEVFIVTSDGPKQVDSKILHTIDFYNIYPQNKLTLTEQMTSQGNVSADELLLLNYELIKEIAKENPTFISHRLQQKNVHPLLISSSSYSLLQILSAVEQDICIELNTMETNSYRLIPTQLRDKITTIIITDADVLGNYTNLKEIFSNLKKIYAHANIAVGFNQFLSENIKVELTFYQDHDESISPHSAKFIEDQGLQTEILLPTSNEQFGNFMKNNKTVSFYHTINPNMLEPNTTSIRINECKIQEKLTLAPQSLLEVTELDLNNTTITATNFITLLQSAPNLRSLTLYSCEIQEKLTLAPQSLLEVTKLDLNTTTITATNFITLLQSASNLRYLGLSYCEIQEELTLAPKSLLAVRSISLRKKITAANFITLLQSAPNLRSLTLYSWKIQGILILEPNSLPEIIKIILEDTTITAANLMQLLRAAPNVRELVLYSCEIQGILILEPNSLPEIIKIHLQYSTSTAITAANLMQLLKAAHNVRNVNLLSVEIQGELTLEPNSLPEIIEINLPDSTIAVNNLAILLRATSNVVRLKLIVKEYNIIKQLPELLSNFLFPNLHYVHVHLELTRDQKFVNWLRQVAPNLYQISGMQVHELIIPIAKSSSPASISHKRTSNSSHRKRIFHKRTSNYQSASSIISSDSNAINNPINNTVDSDTQFIRLEGNTITATNLMQFLKAAHNLRKLTLYSCEIKGILILEPNSLPKIIEINLQDSTITANDLATLLRATSNVVELKLIVKEHNIIKQLPELLSNFFFPNLHYVHVHLELTTDQKFVNWLRQVAPNLYQTSEMQVHEPIIQESFFHTRISNYQSASSIISSDSNAINNPINNTVDSDTQFIRHSKIQCYTGYITLLEGKIIFPYAREHVYNIIPSSNTSEILKEEIHANNFQPVNITLTICENKHHLINPSTLINRSQHKTPNLYQTIQSLALTTNKKYKLRSMTANDRLINLQIILEDSSVAPTLLVEYCSDDNFYYISANKICNITAISCLMVEPQQPLFQDLQITKLIKEFQAFHIPNQASENNFALTGITDQSTGSERVEAMYMQKKGSCRHRVAAFLHQFNKLQKQQNILNNIKARGVSGGGHAWIEISYDNGNTWQIEDLRGYPVDINLVQAEQSELIAQPQTRVDNQQMPTIQTQETSITAQKLPLFAQVQITPKYRNIQNFLFNILQTIKPIEKNKVQNNRILLEMQNANLLDKMRHLIFLHFTTEKIHTLGIDQYTDLQSTNPSVMVQNLNQTEWAIKSSGGKLLDFLSSPQVEASKVLLIDWSKLTSSDMVSVNGIIDDHCRQVDTVNIPNEVTIIGLITPPQKPGEANFLEDPSFTSRHDQIIKIQFTAEELDKAINSYNHETIVLEDTNEPVIINLYNSPNWRNLLFGQCTINHDHREWQKGPFILALEQGLPIVIKNGPWDDYLFARYMSDLTITGQVTCYNQIIKLKKQPLIISRTDEYNFIELAKQIRQIVFNVTTNNCSEIDYLVNSATLERCFVNEKVEVATSQLVRHPGWLQMHQERSISLLITDNLNLQQWTYLLEVAKKHNVKIQLNLTPNVNAPEELLQYITMVTQISFAIPTPSKTITDDLVSVMHLFNPKQKCYFFTTSDPECLAIALQQNIIAQQLEQDLLILDLSELTDEDLLYKNNFVMTQEDKFEFTEKITAVWEKLSGNPNATIILQGRCSKEVISHLGSLFVPSGYLWHQGKKEAFSGRLVLITEPNSDCDFIAPQQEFIITLSLKQITILKAIGLNNDNGLQELTEIFKTNEDLTQLWNQPYSNILQAVTYAKAVFTKYNYKISINDALLGRYIMPDIEETECLDLSIEGSNKFKQQRRDAVDFMLSFSPYCILESVAGTGKSSFIKEYAVPPHKLFLLNQLEEWITRKSEDNSKKILFVDEANLANTDWTQFSGLFNQPATILIDGKIHSVPAECKVIFAQNPVNYGGGREISSLFVKHPSIIVFPPMSAAYIYQNILLPILNVKFIEADCEFVARYIFKKYDLSAFKEPEKHGLTVRVLQNEALKYCATIEKADKIIERLHSQHTIPEQPFHVLIQDFPVDESTEEYIMTESRKKIDAHLCDIIQIQKFRHHLAKNYTAATAALLYGGQNALLLEGPPGVGKSELIKYLLTKYKFTQIQNEDTEQLKPGTGYYFIPASMNISVKLKLLEQAFQQGHIVVCEEINSNQILEQYINVYLMGDDPTMNRPNNPGFALIGTYNSASLHGRRLLSPALRSRAINCILTEYTEEELMHIVLTKYKHCDYSQEFLQHVIKQFLIQQHQARQDKSLPMPNLRNLLRSFTQNFQNNDVHSLLWLYKSSRSGNKFVDQSSMPLQSHLHQSTISPPVINNIASGSFI